MLVATHVIKHLPRVLQLPAANRRNPIGCNAFEKPRRNFSVFSLLLLCSLMSGCAALMFGPNSDEPTPGLTEAVEEWVRQFGRSSDGTYTTKYLCERKKCEGHIRGGKKDGTFTLWDASGRVRAYAQFSGGVPRKVAAWDDLGSRFEWEFREDGLLVRDASWYRNGGAQWVNECGEGVPMCLGGGPPHAQKDNYLRSEKDASGPARIIGRKQEWNVSGSKTHESEYTQYGTFHTREWYTNGCQATEVYFNTSREPDGQRTVWYPNGAIAERLVYDSGKALKDEYWDASGNLVAEGRRRHGEKWSGMFIEWETNGAPRIAAYENGTKVSSAGIDLPAKPTVSLKVE